MVAGLAVPTFVHNVPVLSNAGVACKVPPDGVHEMLRLLPDLDMLTRTFEIVGVTAPLTVTTPPNLPAR